MKLFIQIPALNEENTLAATLLEIPREYPGISSVHLVLIDDGSTDRTIEVARQGGVQHIVSHRIRRGLASAFRSGLDYCLEQGADIIVNTDADNQYPGRYIPALIAPIVNGKADVAIGTRPIHSIQEFSPLKKILQNLGSLVLSFVAGLRIHDATSGFRAFNREAAANLNLVTRFTYTLESLIQLGQKGFQIEQVPISVNAQTRPSRLFRSNWSYIRKSIPDMTRIYMLYSGHRVTLACGSALSLCGVLLGIRYIWLVYGLGETGFTQSLILATILVTVGFQLILFSMLASAQIIQLRLTERLMSRRWSQR